MKRKSIWSRFVRSAMALSIGGSAFALSGCDPNVRATLLDGLQTTTQTLSSALIQAYFLSLENSGGDGFTTTSP
jgi:hypothetical protein